MVIFLNKTVIFLLLLISSNQILNCMKAIQLPLFSIFLFSIFLISCEDEDCRKKFLVVNNSDHAIYFDQNFLYPDTIPRNTGLSLNGITNRVESHSSKYSYDRDCLNDLLQEEYPVLMVFIFDAATVDTTPWDTICSRYLILKRYDLDYHEMDSMNWTITYP